MGTSKLLSVSKSILGDILNFPIERLQLDDNIEYIICSSSNLISVLEGCTFISIFLVSNSRNMK